MQHAKCETNSSGKLKAQSKLRKCGEFQKVTTTNLIQPEKKEKKKTFHDSSLAEMEIENNDNYYQILLKGGAKIMQFCWKQKGFRLNSKKNALSG